MIVALAILACVLYPMVAVLSLLPFAVTFNGVSDNKLTALCLFWPITWIYLIFFRAR